MLIDDNKIDLFINQKIIEKESALCNIEAFTSANSAMKYLKILENVMDYNTFSKPDIIFLDINMPDMSGFQFLEAFKALNIENKSSIKIYMLSSSVNIIDIQKVKNEESCIGFINKPLTKETIKSVFNNYKLEKENNFQENI